ncbi:MAG: GAF domain-containing protein [Marinifilaceae bacterium]|jgi:GAF domain-containing protein|nr:GAF domain-containing protein [Marinifilaceae bacterium]
MNFNDIKIGVKQLPFTTQLSFKPLLESLKESINEGGLTGVIAKEVLKEFETIPDFNKDVFTDSDIEKHKTKIESLLSLMFDANKISDNIGLASVPFSDKNIFYTKNFLNIYNEKSTEICFIQNGVKNRKEFKLWISMIHAYWLIFNKIYNIDIDVRQFFKCKIRNKKDNTEKYYKIKLDTSCLNISHKSKFPKFTKEDYNQLINDPLDMDLWMKKLPIKDFIFSGFFMLHFIDITESESISELKSQLLEKTAIDDQNNFNELENRLKNLIAIPNLKMGIIAMGKHNKNIFAYSELWRGLLNLEKYTCDNYENSIYHECIKSKNVVIVDDLESRKRDCQVEKGLLKKNIRSICVIPLVHDDELVGLLEFGSPKPYVINFSKLYMLDDIIPIFSIAIIRRKNELENLVEGTIKEHCTAIHPSVEWKFKDAAAKLIINKHNNQNAEMEEIVFKNVHPLYGAIDIRNSSLIRGKTIQDDLITHIELVSNILIKLYEENELPIYDQLNHKLYGYYNDIADGVSAGEESSVLNFIKREIEVIFDNYEGDNNEIISAINDYKIQTDTEIGTIYNRRKKFEDSFQLITNTINQYIELEQEKAQNMFPHYFEKYRTDGVEHNIYIGQSLTPERKYDSIYLKNLRIWQLLTSIEIIKKTSQLKSEMPIELDTTGLILVHSQSLSIRFRPDEKKFDVDGAYNIRYEIIKKRIDKAYVKNTNERLTQPGKIAVIFTRPEEKDEYRRYFEYLAAKGLIDHNIEELKLEDMQAVNGLHAIRVSINLNSDQAKELINKEGATKELRSIG